MIAPPPTPEKPTAERPTLRQRVRRLAPIAAAAAVAVCVLVALVVLASRYLAFRRQLEGFSGVRIGDSRAEVMYRWGRPESVMVPDPAFPNDGLRVYLVGGPGRMQQETIPEGKQINDFTYWGYPAERDGDITLTFNAGGRVRVMDFTFVREPHLDAEGRTVAGVRIGSPEQLVLELGAPTRSSIHEASGVKTIEFEDLGLEFLLMRGRVYSIRLREVPTSEWIRLRRFLRGL